MNFSLVVRSGDNFDFLGGDNTTNLGNQAALESAIDPSRFGHEVLLDFDAATSYTYSDQHYANDVLRASGFSSVLIRLSISQAMGDVIRELFEEGKIRTIADDRLVMYGSDGADGICHYTSRIGVNVSDPGTTFPNPLHEYAESGLIYVAGAGADTVTGTNS